MAQLEHIEAIEKRLWSAADTLRANSTFASNEFFLPVGGEFFTPISLVSLIANVLEPGNGVVLDPACGSGGMFVQSARVVERRHENPSERLTFYGMEKNATTIRLAKMNLAVHGLEGDIQKAISYYEDPHELIGKADFVMANPPFNVDEIDAEKVKGDPRLPFGLPSVNKKGKVSNGNYVWMSYFYSYLKETGRAGFVMAAGAETAGRDEAIVRRKMIETGDVDIMVAIRSNFFYTRTVPCMLWFLNRDKKIAAHKRQVLMIDARNVYRKVTRKIYDFSPEQEQNLLAIVWLYRGETERFKALVKSYRGKSVAVDLSSVSEFWSELEQKRATATVEEIETATKARLAALEAEAAKENDPKKARDILKTKKPLEEKSMAAVEALKLKAYYLQQAEWLETRFPEAKYRDVEGLVKAVSLDEIAANDWSLTPGRYVGVTEDEGDDEDFTESMTALHEELKDLNAKAAHLATAIDANWKELMK